MPDDPHPAIPTSMVVKGYRSPDADPHAGRAQRDSLATLSTWTTLPPPLTQPLLRCLGHNVDAAALLHWMGREGAVVRGRTKVLLMLEAGRARRCHPTPLSFATARSTAGPVAVPFHLAWLKLVVLLVRSGYW
jgi:hypothetical protein